MDINPHFKNVDINKSKNYIKLARVPNLVLTKKLLLSSHIEHFLFYYNGIDEKLEKFIQTFPNKKYKKIKYSKRSDLESLINACAKNKGRMIRILIIANEDNVKSISFALEN